MSTPDTPDTPGARSPRAVSPHPVSPHPASPHPVDLLVIGSGIAGLTAALRAAEIAPRAELLIVTKGALAEGATCRAQGGIAGAWDAQDDPAEHARDTLRAGAELGDPAAVQVLCEQARSAIDTLIADGVAFDRTPEGTYALGLEGAHSRPRILHVGGDATGRGIEDALVAAVRARGIPVLEHAALVDLLVEDGAVRGAELLHADGTRNTVRGGATLLATGGAGQLYSRTTTPSVATGDGIAAAWRAGAEAADMEFTQFHPTALAAPGGEEGDSGAFLLSEAVRGEGAVLRDVQGRRFMPTLHPQAELAPRDVVARSIAQVMASQGGRPVLLDARGIGEQRLRERFPSIGAALAAAGIDIARELVPVTPAAHYLMGGIRTDLDGRTTLPGLFAAGECACTGVHGANRLASNSLLEGAVFGARSARAALAGTPPAGKAMAGTAPAGAVPTGTATAAGRRTPPRRPSGTQRWSRGDLQHLMWTSAGLLREGERMREAAAQLAAWSPPAQLTTIDAVEDRNLLDLARLVLDHALARPASVGAHHRLDAPQEALAC